MIYPMCTSPSQLWRPQRSPKNNKRARVSQRLSKYINIQRTMITQQYLITSLSTLVLLLIFSCHSFILDLTHKYHISSFQCIPTLHVHMHFFRVYRYSVSEHSRQCSLSSPSSSRIRDLLHSRGVVINMITFPYTMIFMNAQLFIDSSLLTVSNILISINTNKIMTIHIACN